MSISRATQARRWTGIATLVLLVAASGCHHDGATGNHSTPTAKHSATSTACASAPTTFANIVARVRPAVVNLYSRIKSGTQPATKSSAGAGAVPQQRARESLGSGFIITANGLVLTNYHVVKNASEIRARLLDNRWFEATIVGTDPKSDVALLRLKKARGLPAAHLGDSSHLRVGDWVIAIGNPLGLTSTVTAGIASAVGRKNIPLERGMRYQDFIQTDASINPGNSGGPLVDIHGDVIGINTAIVTHGQGLGFAIPINMVRDILPKLKKGGQVKRSWLGLFVDNVNTPIRHQLALPDDGGALVTGVVKNGPAARAGIHKGDVILDIAGKDVNDVSQLAWVAGNLGIGKTVTVHVWRGDHRVTCKLTLASQPH